MTSISSVSSSYQTQQLQAMPRHGKGQDHLFQKADTDGSGGVDSTELQTMLDHVAKKTGVSLDVSGQDVLKQADANSDGTLDSTELKTAMESVLPPPSTMDFAQSRSASGNGQAGDDLFGKVDADGSGGVSATELQAMLDAMNGQNGATSSSSSTDSSSTATDMLKQLDTDGNGSLSQAEFDAGRPSGPPPMEGMGGHMPPPSSSSSGTSEVSTDAQTLSDGLQALKDLFKSADTDGNSSLTETELNAFVQKLLTQYTQVSQGGTSSTTGSTLNASA